MSDQLHDDQVEELEQGAELQEEESTSEDEDESSEEEDDEDGVIVTIGDEKPPVEDEEEKTAPKWVKDLRKQTKEQAKRIRELEQEREAAKATSAPKVPDLGPKPTLDDCDYDAEEFEARLTAWHDRKRQVDQEKVEVEKKQEADKQAWQAKLSRYAESQANLKVKDFSDAEESVKGILDDTQHAIIVQVAKDPALMVYAIAKNPKKAAELAAIKNYIDFAHALGELSKEMKVTTRKAATQPESKVRSGGASISGSVDSNLERLRAEAEKTGDMSKVAAYKRQQREKQKA
jgi:hypothetical protein